MSEYGLIIVLASIAAIVSFVSGIMAGVTFGGIIVRLIISSSVFAFLGYIITVITKKYLPEIYDDSLMEKNESESAADDDSLTGENIDVVLPDENPHADGYSGEKSEKAIEIKDEYDIENEETSDVDDIDTADYSNEFVEEVNEVDENGDDEERGPVVKKTNNKNSDFDEDVFVDDSGGSLPDLDSFSDSFSDSSIAPDREEEHNEISNFKTDSKLDMFGLEKDAGNMAKAVQTFMKKDQEGK